MSSSQISSRCVKGGWFDVRTGAYQACRARAVVLAGGSAIAIQKYASANFLTTDDAYVAAFDIGAPLANLEFLGFVLIPALGGFRKRRTVQ